MPSARSVLPTSSASASGTTQYAAAESRNSPFQAASAWQWPATHASAACRQRAAARAHKGRLAVGPPARDVLRFFFNTIAARQQLGIWRHGEDISTGIRARLQLMPRQLVLHPDLAARGWAPATCAVRHPIHRLRPRHAEAAAMSRGLCCSKPVRLCAVRLWRSGA